jgi:CysZ protein
MLAALYKSFAQLGDPRLRRVLRLGLLIAVPCYLLLVVAVAAVVKNVHFFQPEWADVSAGVALGLVALVLPILFFPALVTAVMSFMLEDVANAVEGRHYPALNWPRPQKWGEVLATTLRFLLVIVAANLLALPLYVTLLVTGLTLPLGYLLNGYLLGREYFELVALRRLDPAEARLLFRNHLGRLWLSGAVITLLFQIPLVNLAAPVLATAFMVHQFQALQRGPSKV